jgi:SAM-dependent methyltransferase
MTDDAVRFYERDSLHVAIYDAMAATVPGGDDFAFFRSLAEQTGGPVLELGCGTGRVAIPLAEAGFDVTGIDRSAAMLARARRKAGLLPPEAAGRIQFVEGDFVNAVAGEAFGLIFAAYRVFMSVLEPDDQLRALTAARGQLRPGGILAIDVFDPRYDLLAPGAPPRQPEPGPYLNPDTGRPVRTTVLDRVADQVAQQFVEHWSFEELDELGHPGRSEVEALRLRWTFRHEMRHLLERAGFVPVAEYSDYAMSPPAYGNEQIWIARRPVG